MSEDTKFDLGKYQAAVDRRLAEWTRQDLVSRIWRKDPSVWSSDPGTKELADRLGWLDSPALMRERCADITAFAAQVKSEGCRYVVLLGMGGSSLAPAVFQDTFGNSPGFPELIVLDSTHPSAIRTVRSKIDPLKTFFLVSSKSGTTLETLTLFDYFWDQVSRETDEPGRHFGAITDPGTPLEETAGRRRFRRVFSAPADVGGRYSALTVFGLVPAALIGIDVARMLDKAQQMAEDCRAGDAAQNPGIVLGAVLGEQAHAGRDKITFVTDPALAAFPLWLEQLIAESTGKDGKGLIPVAGETPAAPESYGADRAFVVLATAKPGSGRDEALDRLQKAGFPVLRIVLEELADLGSEFFRWELAVAAAGAAMGLHPFDQPDVQLAKDLARKAMESRDPSGTGAGCLSLARKDELAAALDGWIRAWRPGDYVAIQAYLEPGAAVNAGIDRLRNRLRTKGQAAITTGYGPRFLHSTGQLHKGGPAGGTFLQLVDQPAEDIDVPERGYTFGTLIRAQAEGDYRALQSRSRRVIRIDLGSDPTAALAQLSSLV